MIGETESLFGWDTAAARLPELRERLRRRPEYPAAARRLAANLLRDAAEDPSLDAMLRDAGHNVAALSAIYLHASGDVTLSRMKAFIAGFGLTSPGRARAMLAHMRHLRYLEAEPSGRRARPARYTVTRRFLAAYARHEASILDAIRIVEPTAGLLLKNLAAPGVLEAFVIEQGDAFVAGSGQARPYAAFYGVFLHRLAGIQMLHGLVAQADAFPPRGDILFSASATARRFNVSRAHVARVIKAAEAEGFLITTPRALRFTETGLEALDWLYASRLCLNLASAARVLKAHPQLRSSAAA